MTDRPENRRTINGADLDYMHDDVKRGDLDRGFFDAGPDTKYGDRPPGGSEGGEGNGTMPMLYGGGYGVTRRQGMIEDEGFHETHGDHSEHGFVRRPTYRSDIERE